ncbi:MAG: peptidoglycan DD-metalloendopeptidase family protein [Anaerolineae bacterium]|nr:peptidoglycan DD-metalloendopeptidase family protein [Anaerolineae bacterium]
MENLADEKEGIDASPPSKSSRALSRFLVWASLFAWRSGVDWRTRRPVFTRITAHASIVVLALVLFVLGGLKPVGQVLGASEMRRSPTPPPMTPAPDVTPYALSGGSWEPSPALVLNRMAVPHTNIPERPRNTVFTYTVLPGDTVFGIAEMFGLSPHTIYWANSDTLQDNPHMLWPDTVLNILPVNGVYHTVSAGETIASIAQDYGVDIGTLYNEWNHLTPNQPLQDGMSLVIPGGTRDFIVWQLPTFSSLAGSAAYDSGVCALPATGVRGNGWFTWPTDSRRISGWVFHDPRNPPHAGIDIGLYTGDPLYAADNGVVRYAGWSNAGYGYLVVLDHGNGYQTYYAHMSAIWVVCGQSVYQGTAIGAGGNTGWSTGPHLHFEVRYEGIPQDPFYYLP